MEQPCPLAALRDKVKISSSALKIRGSANLFQDLSQSGVFNEKSSIELLNMDTMYFLSDSTSDNIPEQLELIVSRLPNGANEEELFLGLVFILALETGFQAFHRWVFAQELNITIEFFKSQNSLIAIVTGNVAWSRLIVKAAASRCQNSCLDQRKNVLP
ncbi:Hypothetical predicted protein [Cloeon dipterum]|uniref:Uncharacterized protein n=1 Tax=Cloeon dipterum TaxID=197152 RepID=A0A8S1CQP8_9INSE|nr:Hypothetical predicted protein [Cloeon dipterum]